MTLIHRFAVVVASMIAGFLVGGIVGVVTLAILEPHLGPMAWEFDLLLAGCGAISGMTTSLFKWSWIQVLVLCILSGVLPFIVWMFSMFNHIMDDPLAAISSLMWQTAYAVPTVLSATAFVDRIFLPILAQKRLFAPIQPTGRRR